jgi:hypothetical protein
MLHPYPLTDNKKTGQSAETWPVFYSNLGLGSRGV